MSWVLTPSGVCNTGRLGAQGLYNISTPVSSANVRPGDLIFFVGTYDTPGVSHVGIYVGGGKMLHCGDPIQYADINPKNRISKTQNFLSKFLKSVRVQLANIHHAAHKNFPVTKVEITGRRRSKKRCKPRKKACSGAFWRPREDLNLRPHA